MLNLTGDMTDSVLSDSAGNYSFTVLIPGSYTITPTRTPLPAGSGGIATADVLAANRHYLGLTPLPPGCRLAAAEVTGDSIVNTQDVIAIQRFFLGRTFGTGNVGHFAFIPASRAYPDLGGNQTAQDFDVFVYGDLTSPFANRSESPLPNVAITASSNAIPVTIALPELPTTRSRTHGVAAVTVSPIAAKMNLVGFQSDFTFDERILQFQDEPVRKAGLTAGNWSVVGNVLDGTGPIRTLRISAYSTDFKPLSGVGTLFELQLKQIKEGAGVTLHFYAPPNDFIFINADLNAQRPTHSR